MAVLVLNAGSSSLKFALFTADSEPSLILKGQVSGLASRPQFETSTTAPIACPGVATLADAHQYLMRWLAEQGHDPKGLAGVGHRIVHGGIKYSAPVPVNDTVLKELDALRALAPLHLPSGLGVLHRMYEQAPLVPQIACFDTAFHATQPGIAKRLPLPRAYYDRGYRRYGFHGLSYENIVGALPKLSQRPLPHRLLAAHLGNGASMCAIVDGKSVATTMGYSTADGLVMGTRTGSIDPGVIIALMRDDKLGIIELEDLLYRRSGLLGLSGISSDMRQLLASDRPEALEAVEYYCHSAARYAASLVAAMGGLDAMVFTGGVGENAAAVRERIVGQLKWLGLAVDDRRNLTGEFEISASDATKPIYIVQANEEQVIARHTLFLIR